MYNIPGGPVGGGWNNDGIAEVGVVPDPNKGAGAIWGGIIMEPNQKWAWQLKNN